MATIRAADNRDIDSMAGLLRQLFAIEADFVFEAERQRRGLSLLLADPHCCLLAAEEQGQVVGMASGQVVISTAEGGPALLVEDVVVSEGWRGQGIGRALIVAMESWARSHKIFRLQLLADRGNTQALGFYRRLGWQGTQLICLRCYSGKDQNEQTTTSEGGKR